MEFMPGHDFTAKTKSSNSFFFGDQQISNTGTSLTIFFFVYQVNLECHLGWVAFKIYLVNKKENGEGCSSRSQISFFLTDDFPKSLDDFVFAVKS